MVIDVEGYEWEVLKNFKIHLWKPTLVVIELHDNVPNYKCLEEECNNIVDFFEKHNYKAVYKDNTNTVYKLDE